MAYDVSAEVMASKINNLETVRPSRVKVTRTDLGPWMNQLRPACATIRQRVARASALRIPHKVRAQASASGALPQTQ